MTLAVKVNVMKGANFYYKRGSYGPKVMSKCAKKNYVTMTIDRQIIVTMETSLSVATYMGRKDSRNSNNLNTKHLSNQS